MRVNIYSDGGADPNPGIGGWAAILRAGGHERVLTGNEPHTTNNRMELQAAISALEAVNRPSEIAFYTDSEYLRRGITEWVEQWEANGWRRKDKPVANADLWQALLLLVRQHEVEWHWVKGHAGDPLNERVDRLARHARLEITPSIKPATNAIRLYARGRCKGNPGPGGWGVVLERGEDTEQMSGAAARTTNNQMELTAVIEGLRLLAPGSAVQIITTSDYVFQGATKWIHGWQRRDWKKKDGKPVSNLELWQQLDRMMNLYDLHWMNAKGQAGRQVTGLEEAGILASDAVQLAS